MAPSKDSTIEIVILNLDDKSASFFEKKMAHLIMLMKYQSWRNVSKNFKSFIAKFFCQNYIYRYDCLKIYSRSFFRKENKT